MKCLVLYPEDRNALPLLMYGGPQHIDPEETEEESGFLNSITYENCPEAVPFTEKNPDR